MVNLVETAERLATMGIVVSLDVRCWDGMIPARTEWGGAKIRVMHDRSVSGLREAKNQLLDNLFSSSIAGDCGSFVPNAGISAWVNRHDQLMVAFEKVRDITLAGRDQMIESARSGAAALCREGWGMDHGGEQPPPSAVVYASGLAASLVPPADVLRESFVVMRRVRTHSFLSSLSDDRRFSFIGYGERNNSAWVVIDELVAGNAMRLKSGLESARPASNNWSPRYSKRAFDAAVEFVRTDLMPELGLSRAAQGIVALLEGVAENDIDGQALCSAIEPCMALAKRLSSVSGVLEAMG